MKIRKIENEKKNKNLRQIELHEIKIQKKKVYIPKFNVRNKVLGHEYENAS